MKLSSIFLKKIIRESLNQQLLIEGVADTVARATGLKDTNRIEQLRVASEKPYKLQKPDLLWLARYFMSPEGVNTQEPIKDIVAAIKNFKASRQRLVNLGQSSNIDHYKTPNDLNAASSRGKGYLHQSQLAKEAQKLFDSGGWQVWLPFTRESSCTLGKGTTWCTALASRGNNLFYNYIMKEGVILYYVKYAGSKTIDNNYFAMSLGVINGKIIFPGEGDGFGGITVTSQNSGLTRNEFTKVITEYSDNNNSSLANKIIETIESHASNVKIHPAISKFQKILSNPVLFQNENSGKSFDAIVDLVNTSLEWATANSFPIHSGTINMMNSFTMLDKIKAQKYTKSYKTITKLFESIDLVKSIEAAYYEYLGMLSEENLSTNNLPKTIGVITSDAIKIAMDNIEDALVQQILLDLDSYCKEYHGGTFKETVKKGYMDRYDTAEQLFFEYLIIDGSALFNILHDENYNLYKDTNLSDNVRDQLANEGFHLWWSAPNSYYEHYSGEPDMSIFSEPEQFNFAFSNN